MTQLWPILKEWYFSRERITRASKSPLDSCLKEHSLQDFLTFAWSSQVHPWNTWLSSRRSVSYLWTQSKPPPTRPSTPYTHPNPTPPHHTPPHIELTQFPVLTVWVIYICPTLPSDTCLPGGRAGTEKLTLSPRYTGSLKTKTTITDGDFSKYATVGGGWLTGCRPRWKRQSLSSEPMCSSKLSNSHPI